MVKVWLFSPNSDSVKVIQLKNDFDWDDIRPILRCKWIQPYSFTNSETGYSYCILMNENGVSEDTEYNKVATQVLKKINLNWGNRRLTGRYIVYCYKAIQKQDYEDEEYVDMNIGIVEFIKQFNNVLVNIIASLHFF